MTDSDIKEIRVTYDDDSKIIYRGNGIRKFIREISEPSLESLTPVSESLTPAKSEKVPQTSGGYQVSGVTYTPTNMSAKEMQREAEARGLRFN